MEFREVTLRLVAVENADVVVALRGDAILRRGRRGVCAEVARVSQGGHLLAEPVTLVSAQRIEAAILSQLRLAGSDVGKRVGEEARQSGELENVALPDMRDAEES